MAVTSERTESVHRQGQRAVRSKKDKNIEDGSRKVHGAGAWEVQRDGNDWSNHENTKGGKHERREQL